MPCPSLGYSQTHPSLHLHGKNVPNMSSQSNRFTCKCKLINFFFYFACSTSFGQLPLQNCLTQASTQKKCINVILKTRGLAIISLFGTLVVRVSQYCLKVCMVFCFSIFFLNAADVGHVHLPFHDTVSCKALPGRFVR